MPKERTKSLITSAKSLLPNACEVIPLVPILRKPNSQYTTLKSIEPTAMAPIYAASPICPTMATSTKPKSGTVILDIIDGTANCNIRLFTYSSV